MRPGRLGQDGSAVDRVAAASTLHGYGEPTNLAVVTWNGGTDRTGAAARNTTRQTRMLTRICVDQEWRVAVQASDLNLVRGVVAGD